MNGQDKDALLDQLKKRLPDVPLETDAETLVSYGQDWTRYRQPAPLAVVFPRSVDQVQSIVNTARELAVALVPSGGRTGLSGGAVATRGELVVSMEKMRRMLAFDAVDRTITVEAGMVTAQLQTLAEEQGLYYPVSFAAEGSSQIGGNIATNAGGVKVLRYGLTRDWVLGLKVVSGTGEVLELNKGLIKNASGYDLRHLFIGSEGTLGLIVEATIKLSDPPPQQSVMVLGLMDLDAVMQLYAAAGKNLSLSAFEFFTDQALAHVCEEQGISPPMETACPVYALLEFDDPDESGMESALSLFEEAMEQGWVLDGVVSQSTAQAEELWHYREGISESITRYTPYKNDLSVRISAVPGFLQALDGLVKQRYPDFEVVWFGHIGDGNLHMNVLKPGDMDTGAFETACREVNGAVFKLVAEYQGSVSAEHGIGLLKAAYLAQSRSAEEIALMKGIKQVLDPDHIMNPGKLFMD